MDKDQRIAYINAMVVCAQIEAMGMQAENKYREECGKQIAYDEKSFMDVINKYGIHHNAVIEYLRDY